LEREAGTVALFTEAVEVDGFGVRAGWIAGEELAWADP
jgi:hypothetical protein